MRFFRKKRVIFFINLWVINLLFFWNFLQKPPPHIITSLTYNETIIIICWCSSFAFNFYTPENISRFSVWTWDILNLVEGILLTLSFLGSSDDGLNSFVVDCSMIFLDAPRKFLKISTSHNFRKCRTNKFWRMCLCLDSED